MFMSVQMFSGEASQLPTMWDVCVCALLPSGNDMIAEVNLWLINPKQAAHTKWSIMAVWLWPFHEDLSSPCCSDGAAEKRWKLWATAASRPPTWSRDTLQVESCSCCRQGWWAAAGRQDSASAVTLSRCNSALLPPPPHQEEEKHNLTAGRRLLFFMGGF